MTFAGAAASFSVQLEAQADYSFFAPGGATVADIQTFINQVYTDLFNRTADSAGLAYWTAQLEASIGNPAAVGQFILNVISGAATGSTDDLTLQNKVAVAGFMTTAVQADGATWTSAIAAEFENGARGNDRCLDRRGQPDGGGRSFYGLHGHIGLWPEHH